MASNDDTGEMSVREAGKKGGEKGGKTTSERYGPEHFQDIGHKGGQKVKRLVQEGEQRESEQQ